MKIVNLTNNILNNDLLRTLLLLVSGVGMGYTLQPVPKWLNTLFDTSNILKFFILFIAGSIACYPLDNKKFSLVVICSICTLVLFHMFR